MALEPPRRLSPTTRGSGRCSRASRRSVQPGGGLIKQHSARTSVERLVGNLGL